MSNEPYLAVKPGFAKRVSVCLLSIGALMVSAPKLYSQG
jgi:hypothetical protein